MIENASVSVAPFSTPCSDLFKSIKRRMWLLISV